MAFWREPRRPTAEDQKRTNEVLAAFETSFDGGASKAFVSAGGNTYQPAEPARPVQPHRAQKKGKRAMDEFLEELKARDGLRELA